MIDDRKTTAIQLRRKGLSIKLIAKQLRAAQSSVSIWVRDVELSKDQREALKKNIHSPKVIERRRQTRLKNELAKRSAVIDKAAKRVGANLSKRELWLIGTSLYWAEGTKNHGMVMFSNGDPKMIKLMLRYFRDVCQADENKMRARIHIHQNLDVSRAERYWREITNIPKDRFYKTYNKPNKSSKGTRNSLPRGVCEIYVLDTQLHLKIRGWTQGIYTAANILED